jgi:hypothetical protein
VYAQYLFIFKKLKNMVQVTNYAVRKRKDGTTFITLELTGGLEIQQSQTTGNFYATVKKCSIPSTFEETIAKTMVGQQLDGEVVRIETDPYEYLNKRTGEIMTLQHGYAYRPKGSMELIGHSQVQDVQMA